MGQEVDYYASQSFLDSRFKLGIKMKDIKALNHKEKKHTGLIDKHKRRDLEQ